MAQFQVCPLSENTARVEPQAFTPAVTGKSPFTNLVKSGSPWLAPSVSSVIQPPRETWFFGVIKGSHVTAFRGTKTLGLSNGAQFQMLLLGAVGIQGKSLVTVPSVNATSA